MRRTALLGGGFSDDGAVALFHDGEPAGVVTRVAGATLHRLQPDGASGVQARD